MLRKNNSCTDLHTGSIVWHLKLKELIVQSRDSVIYLLLLPKFQLFVFQHFILATVLFTSQLFPHNQWSRNLVINLKQSAFMVSCMESLLLVEQSVHLSPHILWDATLAGIFFNWIRNLIILLNCGALIVEGMIQYPNLICLIVCRAFQGFFMGHFMTLIPAYISELSPKDVVGNFKVFNQLFFVSGILFAYLLGIVITKIGVPDYMKWRLMFGLNFVVLLFLLLNCLFGIIP